MSAADGTTCTHVDPSALTFEKLMQARRLIDELVPRFDSLFAAKGGHIGGKVKALDHEPWVGETICGLRMTVHEIPPELARRPVLQISPDFPHCSDEFRAQWNAWALERFGTEEVAYMIDSRALARMQANLDANITDILRGVNPRSVLKLRNVT